MNPTIAKITATINKITAKSFDRPATPPKPSKLAMSAITAKMIAQRNIIFLRSVVFIISINAYKCDHVFTLLIKCSISIFFQCGINQECCYTVLVHQECLIMADALRPEFWKTYQLEQLSPAEWEALCDGCGLCCLIKLEDDESNEVAYTKVACKLLDCKTGHCSDYPNRQRHVPDCIQLTPEKLAQIHWLPTTCAYRRLAEGKKLPNWHYLITGSRESVVQARKSAAGRCISESEIHEDEIEDYIVRWVKNH